MELACDIVKINTKYREPKNFTKYINYFKNLNLIDSTKTLTADQFFKKIVGLSIDCDFDKSKNITFTLLTAYYITYYKDQLFDYLTAFENKLISAANSIVLFLEGNYNNINIEEFYASIDIYYALYTTWNSEDKISKIEEYLDNIKETLFVERQTNKSNNNTYICTVNNMYEIDAKFATKVLLQNLKLFNNCLILKNIIWQKIKKYYDNVSQNIFLIIIVELRIVLIQLTTDTKDRKEIYYKIDPEDIIKHIREDTLTQELISKILVLFITKINKIFNGKLQYTQHIHTIDLFQQMYDIIYKH